MRQNKEGGEYQTLKRDCLVALKLEVDTQYCSMEIDCSIFESGWIEEFLLE